MVKNLPITDVHHMFPEGPQTFVVLEPEDVDSSFRFRLVEWLSYARSLRINGEGIERSDLVFRCEGKPFGGIPCNFLIPKMIGIKHPQSTILFV